MENTSGDSAAESASPAARVAQLRATIAAEGSRPPLQLELAIALLANAEEGEAGILLEALPPALYQDPRAIRARARLALRRMITTAPARDVLTAQVARAADDDESRWQLGVRALLEGDTEAGFTHLLDALRAQRADERSPARVALVEAFQMVEDETAVRDARRRMAAVLF